jgi:NTP pyrophosphatase (non-canonical NTP hydrolase)
MKPTPLSRNFLLQRGFCCNNGCTNCPYKNMTFKEYQDKAVKTAIYGTGSTIIYPALGLANEAGEVLGKIKKVLRDKDGKFDNLDTRIAIADEIGDVLWYIAALSRDIDIPLETIAQRNIEKLLDRQARNVIQGSGDNR